MTSTQRLSIILCVLLSLSALLVSLAALNAALMSRSSADVAFDAMSRMLERQSRSGDDLPDNGVRRRTVIRPADLWV